MKQTNSYNGVIKVLVILVDDVILIEVLKFKDPVLAAIQKHGNINRYET